MSEVKRATRVAGRLREALASQLLELRDPRLAGVLVSRVEMTDDLKEARVYVRHELGADAGRARDVLRGMSAASGRLRREASRSLGLRYAPELRFYYDDAPDALEHIERLLREVKKEGGEA